MFTNDSREGVEKRLRTFGTDLKGAKWEPNRDGVELTETLRTGRKLDTEVEITLRKNILAVSINPDAGESVGYQPAAPQYLYPGYVGPVTVAFATDEDAKAAAELPWLVRLHVVPLTVLT